MTDGTCTVRRVECTAVAALFGGRDALEHQHQRAPGRADIDRFVARVEHEYGLLQSAIGRHFASRTLHRRSTLAKVSQGNGCGSRAFESRRAGAGGGAGGHHIVDQKNLVCRFGHPRRAGRRTLLHIAAASRAGQTGLHCGGLLRRSASIREDRGAWQGGPAVRLVEAARPFLRQCSGTGTTASIVRRPKAPAPDIPQSVRASGFMPAYLYRWIRLRSEPS